MAAAAIAETNFNKLPGYLVISRLVKATQHDWIVLPFKGVLPLKATLATGGEETLTHKTLTVKNTETAYDAATTSIAYDGATAASRTATDYYVRSSSGEILLVGADDGAATTEGTLTIKKRGCFGTTAAATGLANDNTLYILQTLTLTGETTGIVDLVYMPLPDDPGVKLYA